MLEGMLAFALVYTVYAAGDPRAGPFGTVGPLAIGLTVEAMVLAAGPFSGGSMNPALAFGSAVIAGRFKNQAIYLVGPLIGAAVAGLLHDIFVFPGEAAVSGTGLGLDFQLLRSSLLIMPIFYLFNAINNLQDEH
ncbi:probable aquaporin TIP5-1 [Durio zibethinus]|uniref:Probable aquaporin TIP5-1 n=1 Tax=Durio zibethinus TaxID=66656 RepID=A0A6P5ZTT5_DURZI|nr:probable aquaporin TIP5-1 [Durio zibethinus]